MRTSSAATAASNRWTPSTSPTTSSATRASAPSSGVRPSSRADATGPPRHPSRHGNRSATARVTSGRQTGEIEAPAEGGDVPVAPAELARAIGYGRARQSRGTPRYSGSHEGGRWHEALELALEQPRECQAREIAVLRSDDLHAHREAGRREACRSGGRRQVGHARVARPERSEEHTSELQSPCNLVCRLLLEKKKK